MQRRAGCSITRVLPEPSAPAERADGAMCLAALDTGNIVVVHFGLGQYTSTIRCRSAFVTCASEQVKLNGRYNTASRILIHTSVPFDSNHL